MMVSGIPSMHICLDFIPELLAQPRTERQVCVKYFVTLQLHDKSCTLFLQVFGVQLAAHVIHQYPVPEAMGIAKDIFKRLTVLASEIPSNIRDGYFSAILPSIALLCKTFPPISTDATEFLVCLTRVSRPADSSLVSAQENEEVGGAGGGGGGSGKNSLITAIRDTFNEIVMTLTT